MNKATAGVLVEELGERLCRCVERLRCRF